MEGLATLVIQAILEPQVQQGILVQLVLMEILEELVIQEIQVAEERQAPLV